MAFTLQCDLNDNEYATAECWPWQTNNAIGENLMDIHEDTELRQQWKACQERYQQLEHEHNTIKALALSTFARMGAYTLLVFLTLAVLLTPLFLDSWEPYVQPTEAAVLGLAFIFVIVLLVMNFVQLSKGLNTVGDDLRQGVSETLDAGRSKNRASGG